MATTVSLGALPTKVAGMEWTLPVVAAVAVGVLILILAVWLLLRAKRPAAPSPQAGAKGPKAPVVSLSPQVWLDHLVDAVRYLSTRREWRYRSPWVLLVGQQGAGKSSLIASLRDGQREAVLLRERKLQVADTHWHFCSGGVLIDPDGALPAADAGTPESRRWERVLDAIDNRRPERPIDAVVLTVSADSLIRAGAAELQTLAESCFRQLWQLQKRFEFILPVYILISQCDSIAGYKAFWQAQPANRRQEIWGWSNPSLTDYEDVPTLIRQLFTEQISCLRQLQVEAAAGKDQIDDADDFFLFPQRFARLSGPLGALLETVLKPSTYHAGFYFRGVYFTGSQAASGAKPTGTSDSVDFVESLFGNKVLAERGLARPVRQGVWSRNRLIRRAQFAAVATVLGLAGVLAWSSVQLVRETKGLGSAFDMVHTVSHQSVVKGRCLEQREVYDVLNAVGTLRADLGFAAIPASWVDSRVTDEASHWLSQKAFQEVVMPAIACRLERRARELTGFQPAKHADTLITTTSVAAASADLTDYVNSAVELERNIDAFREIARPGGDNDRLRQVQLFDGLARYVFGAPPPHATDGLKSVYYEALAQLQYGPPLDLPGNMKSEIARQIDLLADSLHKELLERVALGGRLLDELDGATAPQGGLGDRMSALQDWLVWMRGNWLAGSPKGTPCDRTGTLFSSLVMPLYQRHGYPASLVQVDARFNRMQCVVPAREAMRKISLPPYGQLFVQNDADYMLNPAVAVEVAGFFALRKLSLMQTEGRQHFVCQSASTGWRDESLAQAAGYLHEYQSFATALGIGNENSKPLYDRLARRQLQLVLNRVLSDAQLLPGGSQGGPALDAESMLAARSASFGKQTDNFTKLLTQMQLTGNTAGAEQLNRCLRDYAGDGLQRVDGLAEASRLYQPEIANGEVGGGTRPLYIFGDSAQVKEYLQQQRERSAVLAGYATPFVTYLDGSSPVDNMATSSGSSQGYWRGTLSELKHYREFKEPNGALASLEGYFTKTLATLDYDNCGTALAQAGKSTDGQDLYSQRQRMLAGQSQWRCQDRREADAYMRYRTLASRFNRELAGRFPFSTEVGARDADLATVRAFFHDYDSERDGLDKAIAGLKQSRWGEIRHFLDRLDKAADFLRPTVAAADGIKPVRLDIGFRAVPKQEHGAEQLIAWHLGSGAALADYPGSQRQLDWPFGEAVVLDLNWASQSNWRPVADATQPELKVDGSVASFGNTGNWGLLRFIWDHKPISLPAQDTLDPSRWLLQFDVPLGDGANPVNHGNARVFMTLSLNTVDAKTQAVQPLLLPRDWPRSAPLYW